MTASTRSPALFGRIYKRLLDALRSNDRLTRHIWGVPIHAKAIPFTWDVTTLCLKKALDSLAPAGGYRFLDMGCGHLGLLGQYVKRSRPSARVVSVDLYEDFAENARRNARANGLDVEVRQSDLFADVDGQFDVISFNPPYKPQVGETTLSHPATTFSGADGLEATRRFLAGAPEHLAPGARVFLGINCFFVPEDACLEAATRAGYRVEKVLQRRWNAARVFVLSLPTRPTRADA